MRNLATAIMLIVSSTAFGQLSKCVTERFTCSDNDVEFIQVFRLPGIYPQDGERYIVEANVFTIDMEHVSTYYDDMAIHTWDEPGLYVVMCTDSTYTPTSHGSFFVINEDYVDAFEKNESDLVVVEQSFIINLNDQPVCRKNAPELVQAIWE